MTTGDDLGRVLGAQCNHLGGREYNLLQRTDGIWKTEQYSVTTETIQLNTNFLSNSVGSDFNGSMTVVQSIGLPDGSSYSFTYEDGTYGELSGITLPQGGTITYVYQSGLNGTRAGEDCSAALGFFAYWLERDHRLFHHSSELSRGDWANWTLPHAAQLRDQEWQSRLTISFSLQGDSGYFNDFIYYHTGDQNSTVVADDREDISIFDTLCPIKICKGNRLGICILIWRREAEVFNDTC